jgi:iron complex outermembrane receptor protein
MYYRDQLVPTGELSNVGYSIMTNVDKSYRFGVEISTAIRLSENINWNMNMTLSRNKIVNFIEHYTDYLSSDGSANYLSKNLGTVDIAYSPSAIWTNDLMFRITEWSALHLISKYVGKQYFDNTMNSERTISPYFVNNLRLDLTPVIKNMKGMELQFLVNNFLNEVYENNAYGGNWYADGSEKTWSYYFPQAGINFMLKASVKF